MSETKDERVALRELAHIRFAAPEDSDARALYIDKPISDGSSTSSLMDPATVDPEDILSRTSLHVPEGARVSLGSYFNAFPAGYWQWWTMVKTITLRVKTSGTGRVTVFSSNARAARQQVGSKHVSGDAQTTQFVLSLKTFGDGGWYWFDLSASAKEPLTLDDAAWLTEDNGRHGTATLGMTTFNRPDDAVGNVRIVAAAGELDECVREMIVVDQGNKLVRDDPHFAEASDEMKGRLRVIHQGNLGGSGGYARGMFETLKGRPDGVKSDYFVTLDDDIEVDPESIFRSCTFADYCTRPTIVGSHMFDVYRRGTLLAFGEIVDDYRFNWGPIKGLGSIDFTVKGLRARDVLHRRWDVDYNGWWQCLIPREVIEKIGLPLPIFIKWDDSEYSLRARAAGYPTVSLPGSACWHVSWIDKDDATDWQAYFHERNRLIAALLHSPYRAGGRMVRESVNIFTKHMLSMQYYAATLVQMAIKDVLAGPDGLHEVLESKAAQTRAMKNDFVDGRIITDAAERPVVKSERAVPRITKTKSPNPITLMPWAVSVVARQIFRAPTKLSRSHPERVVAKDDAAWFFLPKLDSALVSNATGTGVSFYQRDPEQVRKHLMADVGLHAELLARWSALSDEYRRALPRITSMEAWGDTFARYPEEGGA